MQMNRAIYPNSYFAGPTHRIPMENKYTFAPNKQLSPVEVGRWTSFKKEHKTVLAWFPSSDTAIECEKPRIPNVERCLVHSPTPSTRITREVGGRKPDDLWQERKVLAPDQCIPEEHSRYFRQEGGPLDGKLGRMPGEYEFRLGGEHYRSLGGVCRDFRRGGALVREPYTPEDRCRYFRQAEREPLTPPEDRCRYFGQTGESVRREPFTPPQDRCRNVGQTDEGVVHRTEVMDGMHASFESCLSTPRSELVENIAEATSITASAVLPESFRHTQATKPPPCLMSHVKGMRRRLDGRAVSGSPPDVNTLDGRFYSFQTEPMLSEAPEERTQYYTLSEAPEETTESRVSRLDMDNMDEF